MALIIEENNKNIVTLDIFSRLLKDRIIFINGEIDKNSACEIQAQLLYLASIDENSDISMYINSPGGDVYAGLGIYDTMCYIKPNVNTICIGEASSMAAVILSAGNHRSMLPNCRAMIHQPWGGLIGTSSDVVNEAKELNRCKIQLINILSKHCNKNFTILEKDLEKDFYLTAEEALKYGLIDNILY